VDPIDRIKQGRLKTREVGGSAVDKGVPKGDAPSRKLREAKSPPSVVLLIDIFSGER